MCPYDGCNKLYGSDVALNLHVKLKHNGGNKTERERLAVSDARRTYLERDHSGAAERPPGPTPAAKVPAWLPRSTHETTLIFLIL